ncbi:chaperone NapD [Varunaivibrio sulfuroxidans]|uniref:Chaperone NapD n=1 Tax=Varunaivibrio sulfuroxidans TaxID=1773489 RepID=A0A4R3JBN7_9PROT|nr:chaperone NapD [Varunaivibrio sulfuroxidans]TCS62473.1 periplasmic nitrate reductase chaperone NapD [Varunaivibrio sulfuroxidans]WES30852.1 chaperone NapD [Varunaivibrio sulfuroxidans]
MSVSGLVVFTHLDGAAIVADALRAIDGVEVHSPGEGGRIVVTVDQPDDGRAVQAMNSIRDVEGVISTSLIYCHFDNFQGDQEDSR